MKRIPHRANHHSKHRNSIPWKFWKFALGAAGVLALAATPAFAQRGGGGGHVGGGGHFGGGGHVGGGGHPMGMAAPHMAAPPHFSSPPVRSFGPPVRMSSPPPAGFGVPRGAGIVMPPVRPPGTMHPVLGNHIVMPPVAPRMVSPPHATIGFPPPVSATRWRTQPGAPLSFSGVGNRIWQNQPVSGARMRTGPAATGRIPPIPQTRPVLTNPFRNRALPGRPLLPANSIRIRRPRIFTGPFGPVIVISPFTGFGFGFGFGPFFGFNNFFGGFGFNTFWGPSCGPFWGWGFGCNTLPFWGGGFGFNTNNYYYPPAPSQVYAQPQTQQEYGPYTYQPPPVAGGERQLAVLILKDGTVYYVTDYWLVNGDLHFLTPNPDNSGTTEQVIDFGELDVQKTVDADSARGFRFVLRNAPMQEYLQEQQQPQEQNPQENQTQPEQQAAPNAQPEQQPAAPPNAQPNPQP